MKKIYKSVCVLALLLVLPIASDAITITSVQAVAVPCEGLITTGNYSLKLDRVGGLPTIVGSLKIAQSNSISASATKFSTTNESQLDFSGLQINKTQCIVKYSTSVGSLSVSWDGINDKIPAHGIAVLRVSAGEKYIGELYRQE
jgi:hypothetical protein